MRHDFKNSSSLAYAEFDNNDKILTICFQSGKEYRYDEVSKHVYDELIEADSPGRYFQANIKPYYKVIE